MLLDLNADKNEILDSILKELSRATVDHKHPFRYVALITCSEKPNSRYVVLREVNQEHSMMIYTDFRSTKIQEILGNDQVQLLFYHPKHRIQIKINGTAKIHHQNEKSNSSWSKVQGDARKAYNTILPPGTPVDSVEEAHKYRDSQDAAFFCVLEIQIQEIEFLQLNQEGHLRGKLTKMESEWILQWLTT